MSFKLFVIPAVVVAILYGFAMASLAHADHASVTVQLWGAECALVDDMVECNVSSEYGISNVHVSVDSGIGEVTVLDQDFAGCPTEVQVSLDPVVLGGTSEMDVTTCGVAIPCDGCSVEICIAALGCEDGLPGVGVGRPDPLPLKSPTGPSVVKPLILSDARMVSR